MRVIQRHRGPIPARFYSALSSPLNLVIAHARGVPYDENAPKYNAASLRRPSLPRSGATRRRNSEPGLMVGHAVPDGRTRARGPRHGHRGGTSQSSTFYIGSTGGGLWKTTDAGYTWVDISNGQIPSGPWTPSKYRSPIPGWS